MGFVYEVACRGISLGVPVANIYHVWDGDEDALLADIADLFEDDLLTDMALLQSDTLTWTEILITPMDYINPINPLARPISVQGAGGADAATTGLHIWVKFQSDDAGEKGGGKLMTGITEGNFTDGLLEIATQVAWQVVMDAFLVDLGIAGLALAIYRPSLSIPGDPEISNVSEILVRGLSTNNRRFQGFTA